MVNVKWLSYILLSLIKNHCLLIYYLKSTSASDTRNIEGVSTSMVCDPLKNTSSVLELKTITHINRLLSLTILIKIFYVLVEQF